MGYDVTILLREKISQQPNGDRDTERHDCSLFEVVIQTENGEVVVAVFDQFDPHWTSIKDFDLVFTAAMKHARDIAALFDETVERETYEWRQKVVTTEEWVLVK